jgi:hypothetical protein
VSFTFYNGNPLAASLPTTLVTPTTAYDMQRRFGRFVQSGSPNAAARAMLPPWPRYGAAATLLNYNVLTTTSTDDAATWRCDYWQSGAWKN